MLFMYMHCINTAIIFLNIYIIVVYFWNYTGETFHSV